MKTKMVVVLAVIVVGLAFIACPKDGFSLQLPSGN